jgi:sugar diacid utilization regulator
VPPEASPVARELSRLIRRAYRSRHTRARLIVAQCLERLPYYRRLPAARLIDVHRSVLHHLALFYRVTLETGRPLTDGDLERSRQIARQRAAQGAPLGDFLSFFQVGLTVIWRHLMALVGRDPELRAQLLARVDAILANQAQLMTALVEAYVEERDRRARFRDEDVDDFFRLLLADDAMDEVVAAQARAIGVPLDEPRTVAVIRPSKADVRPAEVQRLLADPTCGGVAWVGRARDGLVTLLPDALDVPALGAALAPVCGDDTRVGVGGPGHDVDGLRRAAREAVRALRIAVLPRQTQRAYRFADVAMLDLVGVGSRDADDFMRRVLGPLALGGASPTYLEPLRELARHGYRMKLAAAALGVHPNTLAYRVRQLRARFGIDMDDADVRLRVHLALAILDAQGPSADGGPRATTGDRRRLRSYLHGLGFAALHSAQLLMSCT